MYKQVSIRPVGLVTKYKSPQPCTTDHYLVIVEPGGLSRTQVMVISTCTIVIGGFFLVALGLRLRYVIKTIMIYIH